MTEKWRQLVKKAKEKLEDLVEQNKNKLTRLSIQLQLEKYEYS